MSQSVYAKEPSKFVVEMFDWFKDIITYLIIFGLLTSTLISFTTVDGESMLPTLHHKDVIILSKFEPHKGDIVVIHNPGALEKDIIKRIIAVENDTIKFNFDTGEVFVNGKLLNEDYINTKTNLESDWNIPEVIPEGYVFVLGDNRNGSTDSRSRFVKLVDKRDIIGKAWIRPWPLGRFKIF